MREEEKGGTLVLTVSNDGTLTTYDDSGKLAVQIKPKPSEE